MHSHQFQTQRHGTDRVARSTSRFIQLEARVRSVAITQHGHLSCVFDTPAGRLRALSDAPTIHLLELQRGSHFSVALLKIRREAPGTTYHWQLMGCHAVDEGQAAAPDIGEQEVSA